MTPSKLHSPRSNRKGTQSGFTLVEIMVGLAIGMLASLVIMQVFSVFESQKRATTGTADAQTNGSIALYNIGRELQISGYPLTPSNDSPFNCTAMTIDPATGVGDISPATIADGVATAGVSASDRVTIRFGNSAMGGIPAIITAAPVGNDVPVDSNLGCQANDIALVVNGTTCALTSATGLTGATTVTLNDITGAVANATVACMGTWNEITYAVNNGNLERNGVANMAGIVNIQAQYGVSDTPDSNQITLWVDASGGTWAAPTVDNRNRIKAVRIAIVARNPKKEGNAVTAACSSLTDPAPTGLCAWAGTAASPAPEIDLNNNDAEWLHYRYRVFETIIPLRNMIWSKEFL